MQLQKFTAVLQGQVHSSAKFHSIRTSRSADKKCQSSAESTEAKFLPARSKIPEFGE